MPGKINVIRHEAHTGVTATFSAAAKLGHALKVTGDKAVAPAAAGEMVVGTAVSDVAVDEKGTVRILGDMVPMTAEGTVAAGDLIVAGSTTPGTAKARDAGTPEASETVFGVAYTGGADGEQVLVIVR